MNEERLEAYVNPLQLLRQANAISKGSIVSTIWTVAPLATTLLMVKFYKNLKRFPELKAGDVSLALKNAQTWLRTLIRSLRAPENNQALFLFLG